jgi:hypothetical protein
VRSLLQRRSLAASLQIHIPSYHSLYVLRLSHWRFERLGAGHQASRGASAKRAQGNALPCVPVFRVNRCYTHSRVSAYGGAVAYELL